MYMVIRQAQTQPGQMDVAVRAAEEEFWPVVHSVPGFVEYDFLPMGDVGFSVSVFDTQSAAEESNRGIIEFVKQHPRSASTLVEGSYEVVAMGEVRVHKVKQAE